MSITAELPIMLRTLRLPTMGDRWQALLEQAQEEHWSHAHYLAVLCEQEEPVKPFLASILAVL